MTNEQFPISDYDLLLLTYTDNQAPVKPRSCSTNPRFSVYYERVVNSQTYGDLYIERTQISYATKEALQKMKIPLNDAMDIIQDKNEYLTLLNTLKKTAILDNDYYALRERHAFYCLAYDYLEKTIYYKTKRLMEQEYHNLERARNQMLYNLQLEHRARLWSYYQQIRYLPQEEAARQGKKFALREAMLAKIGETYSSYMQYFYDYALQFLKGQNEFRLRQAQVNAFTDDILASENYMSHITGEAKMAYIFNIELPDAELMQID